MADVRLAGVTKRYGALTVVNNLSLTVKDGEFVTLLGASGSGKTTCLRMVAGFVTPDEGQVYIGGVDATNLPPYRRNTGMVFQQYALFPHLTVAENVKYGLSARHVPRQEMQERTLQALQLVHLGALADRYPNQLSGGQQQRVALARAVVIRPSILLLDEPLSALDLKLRAALQLQIRQVQQSLGITTLFVTHDQSEALGISDRIAVMRNGQILQFDTPVGLYQRPNSRYVANFVGMTNFLDVVIRGELPAKGEVRSGYIVALESDSAKIFTVEGDAGLINGEKFCLCIRPENIRILNGEEQGLPATVTKVSFSGDRWILECLYAEGRSIVVALSGIRSAPNLGDKLNFGWDSSDATLLPVADE